MAGDADGWKRGERGFGKDAASSKWAKTVDFNRERNQGPLTGDGAEDPDRDFPYHFIGGKGYKGIDKDDKK